MGWWVLLCLPTWLPQYKCNLQLHPGMANETQNFFEAEEKSSENRGCQKCD